MTDQDVILNTNWRPAAISPFESNWSKIHKFSYLNHIDATIIKTSLCTEEWISKPHLWGRKDGQLLEKGHLSTTKLASIFQTSKYFIYDGWVEPYLVTDLSGQYSYQTKLRYCPECIQKGYHSALYQMLWLVECPIHNVPLLSSCPNCENPIDTSLLNKNLTTPYGCHCKHVLWPDRDSPRWQRALSREQSEIINDVVTWNNEISKKKKSKYISYGFTAGPYSDINRDWNPGDPLETNGFWAELLSLNHLSCVSPHSSQQSTVRKKISLDECKKLSSCILDNATRTRGTDFYQFSSDIEKNLNRLPGLYLPIYKAVRRRIVKLFIKKHFNCVKFINNISSYPSHSREWEICPVSFAYIKWREYWDNRVRAYSNRGEYTINWHPPVAYAINIGSSISSELWLRNIIDSESPVHPTTTWATQHLLAITLVATFIESVLVSFLTDRGEYKVIPKSVISGNMTPYYILELDSDNLTYNLHYWSHSLEEFHHALSNTSVGHNSQSFNQYSKMRDDILNTLREMII